MQSTNDKIRNRIRWVAILFIPVVIVLAVRLYFIQVVQHEFYLEKARARYTTTKVTAGKRGEIFDFHGNLLVSNVPCVHITADPSHLKKPGQRQRLAYLLAAEFPEKSYQDCYDRLVPTRTKKDEDGNVVLKEDGTPETVPNRYAMIARGVSLE